MGISEKAFGFLDSYDRPARLYPAFLVLIPLAVQLVCLYGTANILASSVLSILAFSGVAYVLGRFARDAGKSKQEQFFTKWGGAPTTQLLRHRNERIDVHTKERFHRILSAGLGKTLPSAEQERADPKAADDLYRAATAWLIGRTRDTKRYPLVFKENVAFGFQRNALGLRWLGITVALGCSIWTMAHAQVLTGTAPYLAIEQVFDLKPAIVMSLVVSSATHLAWLVFISESALRRTGFAYGERLLEACDQL